MQDEFNENPLRQKVDRPGEPVFPDLAMIGRIEIEVGPHEFGRRYKHEDLHKCAEEWERLGRENSMPVLWALLAPLEHGLIPNGR
jgi:hypothetical protein